MNQLAATGIILRRTDYGEADRIITFITPEFGKFRAIAKGVRKSKSKLAGGIELFSISELHFIKGKGDIDTLTSTRLIKHFGKIVQDLDRTNAGYEFLRTVMRTTEDNCEPAYYHMLETVLESLNDPLIDLDLIRGWFYHELLLQAGHQPELALDTNDDPLEANARYAFDFESGRFRRIAGDYGTDSSVIKLLRLLGSYGPSQIARIQGINGTTTPAAQLLKQMSEYYIPAGLMNN
jgi:DNA repair protein RecO (recombination protein O)